MVVYAVYYALDDYATYTVDHWRIDGNGELIERVTETVNCITDEVVYAIDRLGDQVKIDNYTAMKKPFTKDDKFIGYTIADDAATVTYKPNLWTTLDHNVRSGRGKADQQPHAVTVLHGRPDQDLLRSGHLRRDDAHGRHQDHGRQLLYRGVRGPACPAYSVQHG